MTYTTIRSQVLAAAVGFGMFAVAPSIASAATGDIVDKAVNTPELSTLVSLVTDAGLVGTLQGTGPFTVFAPTNNAFASMPEFAKRALARDPSLLPSILTYHVVSGEIPSSAVPRVGNVETVAGQKVLVRSNASGVHVNNARVVIADVDATNGVVHVIDKVLIPPSVIQSEISFLRTQVEALLAGAAAHRN